VFDWFVTTINLIDKMNDDILMILVGFLLIVSTLFLWLWFSNRRKYHNLKHAIPANIVKTYLDSIIQNSTALKSQLFRGGGADVGSIPSVIPLQNLIGGEGMAVNGAPSTALLEELNLRKAQISSLEAQLSSLQASQRELDSKASKPQANVSALENKIKDLEALLSQSKNSGGDGISKAEFTNVSKERDELLNRLKEFEIISDDLANLKRLQQENEQLKRSLSAQGGSRAPSIEDEPIGESNQAVPDVSEMFEELGQSEAPSDDNKALEDFLSAPTDSFNEASIEEEPIKEEPVVEEEIIAASEPAPSPAPEQKPKNDRTSEDLLSEFEKMLG
jgi:hypothetical protein